MHKFYKSSSNTSGLPGRITDKLFSRLKKFAHDVWAIESDGSGPVVNRLRADAVDVKDEPEAGGEEVEHAHAHSELEDERGSHLNPGDLVLLFMGGKKIYARIKGIDDATATISTHDGVYEVASSWLRTAQATPVEQDSHTRRPTRDDMPAQADPVYARSAQTLEHMLQAAGGRALVSMGLGQNGQESLMELTKDASGFTAKLLQLEPKVFHTGKYQTMSELVQDLGLTTPGNLKLKNGPK